jgi:transcriptional regulator NrdR family protein
MNVLRQSTSKTHSQSKLKDLVETVKRTLDLPADDESSDDEVPGEIDMEKLYELEKQALMRFTNTIHEKLRVGKIKQRGTSMAEFDRVLRVLMLGILFEQFDCKSDQVINSLKVIN